MEPHDEASRTSSAGAPPSRPGVDGRATSPEVAPVRPEPESRAVRATVGLLAVAAVALIGLAVLAGPGMLGGGTGPAGTGLPAAGAIGPAGEPGAPTAPGRAPGTSAPGASAPSASSAAGPASSAPPRQPYSTSSPAPSPTPTPPPPPDVAVVDHGASALEPSGIRVVGAGGANDWATLVAGADGALWAAGSGGLLRLDPATGDRRVWTIVDDAAFGAVGAVAAAADRDGGVWIAGSAWPALRRFDGERFAEVLDAPGNVTAIAQMTDGTLWVGTTAGLYRRVGETWNGIAFASEQTTVSTLLPDASGALWVGWLQYPTPPGSGWLTRWDGAGWARFDGADATPLGSPVQALREAPDGSIWAGTEGGLARWDGSRWATVKQPLRSVASIAWGPDGTSWIAAGDGYNGAVSVAHRASGGWVTDGPAQGLPDESGWMIASVVPTADGIYVGTGAGIHRLAGDRWTDLDPAPALAVGSPGWASALVAVSRDEGWAANDRGIWHAVGGTWTRTADPAGRSLGEDSPGDLLLDTAGRLWVATRGGVLMSERGAWTVIDEEPATALALGPDGRVWAAGEGDAMNAVRVRSIDRVAGAWKSVELPVTTLITWPRSLAIEADGTIWVGTPGSWGIRPGLLRYTKASGWERVVVRGVTEEEAIYDIAVAPDGALWAAGSDVGPQPTSADEPWVPPPWWIVRLTDGPGPAIVGEGGWGPWSIEVLSDGTPVVPVGGRGLAAWDGTHWTHRHDGLSFDRVSVAPDGAAWVTANGGVLVLP